MSVNRTHRTRSIVVAAALVALAPARMGGTTPAPTVQDLLKAGAAYAEAYSTKVSGTTLEELFILTELSGTQMRVPQRVWSDVVIVKIDVNGRLLGLRDPFSVDKKSLRPREPRIVRALEEPTLASWAAAQGYVRENAILFRANVVLWFSDPMLALQFVATSNQSRVTYNLEGTRRVNGLELYGLGFKEQERPGATSLLATPDNPLSSGRFWIDPSTGAIHQTDLWVQSDTNTARMHVAYAQDPVRGILLPSEASHTFETRERGSGGLIGPGGTKIGIEANVTYTNARYTPIDLSRIAR